MLFGVRSATLCFLQIAVFLCLASVPCYARDVPPKLQELYQNITSADNPCMRPLAEGFYSSDTSSKNYAYCGDYLDSYGIIYLSGTRKNPHKLVNMDIDCDGVLNATTPSGRSAADRCGSSRDTQYVTSFQSIIQDYRLGDNVGDLDAGVHPYVVFGNTGTKRGYKNYDPKSHGVQPLSIIAVVCNNKLVYGIWGDENGDDGKKSVVGEASISLATLCYGESVNGNSGHDDDDVLYVAFVGPDAVPGPRGANWTAGDAKIFEESISKQGNRLVSRIDGTAVPSSACAHGSGVFFIALASAASVALLLV